MVGPNSGDFLHFFLEFQEVRHSHRLSWPSIFYSSQLPSDFLHILEDLGGKTKESFRNLTGQAFYVLEGMEDLFLVVTSD